MANRSNFAEPGTGTGNRTKNFKLAQGSNRYRIGPAYGSLAASGRWNVSINQHYGYHSAEDAQGKAFPRTFICPLEIDRKTEIVKVPCAEHADLEMLSEKLELRKAKLEAEGKDQDEIDTLLGPQKTYLKEHNLDKKHLVLAKNESNEWGVLWLPWKALEALLERRKKVLSEDSFDILSTKDGAWVDFVRSGEGFRNTTYACDVVTEIVVTDSGKKAKVYKQEALEDTDFDSIEANCPDLTTVGTRLTQEQIERLVESRGDADVVEAVFNEARDAKKGKTEASASPAPAPKAAAKPMVKKAVEEDVPDDMVKTPPKAAPKSERVLPDVEASSGVDVKKEVAGEDDEEAALMAQLAAARAKKAAAAKKIEAKPEPSKEPGPTGDPEELPDDEFLKVYAKKTK